MRSRTSSASTSSSSASASGHGGDLIAKAYGVEGFERILAIKKILPTMAEDQEFITMFIDERGSAPS